MGGAPNKKKSYYNTKPKDDATYEGFPKKTKCLCCAKEMMSEWPGNRVCSTCKDSSDWKSGGIDLSYTKPTSMKRGDNTEKQ